MIFLSEPAVFTALGRPGVVRSHPEKIKNPNLIKSFRKGNRANRKGSTSFFGLDFLDFKLVPIDSELNFALEN